MEFLAADFGQAQPWLLQPLGEWPSGWKTSPLPLDSSRPPLRSSEEPDGAAVSPGTKHRGEPWRVGLSPPRRSCSLEASAPGCVGRGSPPGSFLSKLTSGQTSLTSQQLSKNRPSQVGHCPRPLFRNPTGPLGESVTTARHRTAPQLPLGQVYRINSASSRLEGSLAPAPLLL